VNQDRCISISARRRYDRHQGNLDAARPYLEWEQGLFAQCSPQELATFRLDLATR
jgi:hypothetical protein